jgi:mannitol/fructose-specific phosphotransferase system IIA component (Ntr-type)
MDLSDYTIPGGFLPRFKCDTVAVVVDRLVERILEDESTDVATEVTRKVMTRESEVSTAIGGGLIIPHARFRGIGQARLGVATLADPLEVPSEDGKPIDIVILLIGPEGDPRQMLRVLARLARLVRQESFLQGLREATTPDQLRDAFAKAGRS